MDIKVEKKDKNYGLMSLKVTHDDYVPDYNREVKEYSKKASIKGFRPGKVPQGLIKKMMGKDFKLEIFNRKINEAVQKHLEAENIDTILPPSYKGDHLSVAQLDRSKELNLEFEFAFLPQIDLDLSALQVTAYEMEISDDKLNEVIEKLQKDYPAVADAEEIAKDDFVYGKLVWTAGEGETAQQNTKENAVLPTNQLTEKSWELLTGKKVGDTVLFDADTLLDEKDKLRFVLDIEKEEAEAIGGTIEYTVEKIERSSPSELNQEFFDKVVGEGKATDEASFRKEVAELMKNSNERTLASIESTELFDQLTNRYSVEFPEELVKKYIDPESPEAVASERIAQLLKDLKWQSVSRNIMKEGEIKVSREDVTEQARYDLGEQFRSMGIPNFPAEQMDAFLDNYLQMEEGKNAEDAYNKVYVRKVVEFVKEKANVTVQKLTLDELEGKIKELNDKHEAAEKADQAEEPSVELVEEGNSASE